MTLQFTGRLTSQDWVQVLIPSVTSRGATIINKLCGSQLKSIQLGVEACSIDCNTAGLTTSEDPASSNKPRHADNLLQLV